MTPEDYMDCTRKKKIRYGLTLLTVAATTLANYRLLAAHETERFDVKIVADDMCCNGCAQKVTAQLYAAPGVTVVDVDIPNRIVKVTAKPSPKLTLERLWLAVEKGKGAPSKLITAEATYTLTSAEQLKPAERLSPGQYVIEVAEIEDAGELQRITSLLRTIRGVQHVAVDLSKHTLIIQSAIDEPLSMWMLVRFVKQADQSPVRVAGPHGRLAIEHAIEKPRRTAAHQSKNSPGGDLR